MIVKNIGIKKEGPGFVNEYRDVFKLYFNDTRYTLTQVDYGLNRKELAEALGVVLNLLKEEDAK